MTTSKQVVSITAHKINKEYEKAQTSYLGAADHILNLGLMLEKKKAELGHGNFTPWIEGNCNFSPFFASRSIKAWNEMQDKIALGANLDEEDCQRVIRIAWGHDKVRGTQGTGDNEWYTPPDELAIVRHVLGEIELDPASSKHGQKTVKASRYFTKTDDGLKQSWQAETVFLNPPYAQPLIAEFILKFVSEYNMGHIGSAIVLTHNYTDTEWFHTAEASCSLICFTSGRVKFIDAKGNRAAPTQGQAFFYFGKDKKAFRSAFKEIGFVR